MKEIKYNMKETKYNMNDTISIAGHFKRFNPKINKERNHR